MPRRLRLLLVAVPLLLAFAPAPKRKEDDAKSLQGAWSPLRQERDGRVLGPTEIIADKVVITGGRLEVHKGGGRIDYEFTLDPKKKPKEITLHTEFDSSALGVVRLTSPGIYKLEGDTLTICYRKGSLAARPVEFQTTPGGHESLLVLKRVKP